MDFINKDLSFSYTTYHTTYECAWNFPGGIHELVKVTTSWDEMRVWLLDHCLDNYAKVTAVQVITKHSFVGQEERLEKRTVLYSRDMGSLTTNSYNKS